MFTRFLAYILDQVSFIGTPYSLGLRLRLIARYYVMLVKNLFFWSFLTSENILGYKVYASRYKYIFGIFKIAFFKGQYYFSIKKKNPLIIDCGANIGVTTLYFHFLFPDAEIHAFEPNKAVYGYLKKNTSPYKNIYNHEVALADTPGKLQFFVDTKDIGDTNASLNHKTNRVLNDSVEVNAIRLSDFIKNELGGRTIDFIKFNIEWSEDSVIEELAQNDCLKYINRIIFEYHHRSWNPISPCKYAQASRRKWYELYFFSDEFPTS
jgi:FkbM family methyltransferase